MKPSEFNEYCHGRLINAPQGYLAFVPNPLPPRLELTWDLVRLNSEADRVVSKLAGMAKMLPNPHLLIDPFIRREAVLSSRIEGTVASLSDLLFFEASHEKSPQPQDVQEVANYIKALKHGLKRLEEEKGLPLCLRLIREMHERLMKGVRGQERTPGEFRQTQNWIGPPGCSLEDATFVPPPVFEMTEALNQFEQYLHSASSFPPLIRLALIHYQFEAIHPFLDGNGRVGRLLLVTLLSVEKILPQPLLYLSAYFERNREQYYDLLLKVSQRGAWQEWIHFFLRGVIDQSNDAKRRSERLLNLKEEYSKKLAPVRSNLPLRLAEALFYFPAITIPWASKRLGVTYISARKTIEKLINHQILKEETRLGGGSRIFIAPDIIEIIEAGRPTETD